MNNTSIQCYYNIFYNQNMVKNKSLFNIKDNSEININSIQYEDKLINYMSRQVSILKTYAKTCYIKLFIVIISN